MPNLLPTLFIVLGACALVLTLYWLWHSLRGAFLQLSPLGGAGEAEASSERAALLSEKAALLVALKDLEAERDSGKLSEGDFKELNTRYRARAREVLRRLDAQIAPHRDAARAMLSGTLAVVAVGGGEAAAPGAGEAAAAAAASPAARGCAACGVENDPDAVFCKKCGARIEASA